MLIEIDVKSGESFLVHKDLIVRVMKKENDGCEIFVRRPDSSFGLLDSYEDIKGYTWFRRILFLKELNSDRKF